MSDNYHYHRFREPYQPWTNPRPNSPYNVGHVLILHPGYDASQPMLTLTASDDGGVHYDVAYYSCCIIAGNIWHDDEGHNLEIHNQPFFSSNRTIEGRIMVPQDKILRQQVYYFHVPSGPVGHPYPVVANFCHWPFPHDNIPKPWRTIDQTRNRHLYKATSIPVGPCYLVGSNLASSQYYIIPKAETYWANGNGMNKYFMQCRSLPVELIDRANLVPFRTDIQQLMDRCHLVPFPKDIHAPSPSPQNHVRPSSGTSSVDLNTASSDRPTEYRWVMHMLRGSSFLDEDLAWELLDVFHNRALHSMDWVPAEVLLARFAWSLFNDETFGLFHALGTEAFSVLIRERPMDCYKPTMRLESRQKSTLPLLRPRESNRGSLPEPDSPQEPDENKPNPNRYEGLGNDSNYGLDYGYYDSSDEDDGDLGQ